LPATIMNDSEGDDGDLTEVSWLKDTLERLPGRSINSVPFPSPSLPESPAHTAAVFVGTFRSV